MDHKLMDSWRYFGLKVLKFWSGFCALRRSISRERLASFCVKLVYKPCAVSCSSRLLLNQCRLAGWSSEKKPSTHRVLLCDTGSCSGSGSGDGVVAAGSVGFVVVGAAVVVGVVAELFLHCEYHGLPMMQGRWARLAYCADGCATDLSLFLLSSTLL